MSTMRWVILAGLLLTACAREEPVPEVVSYRDRSVPIASQVDVSLADLDGAWNVRAAIGDWPVDTRVSFDIAEMEMRVSTDPDLSLDGDGSVIMVVTSHDIQSFGQGRLEAVATRRFVNGIGYVEEAGARVYWILWADADRRTMAIGTPDGSFGFILDRAPTGGEDRIAAARDIMEWMGYRVDEMVSP